MSRSNTQINSNKNSTSTNNNRSSNSNNNSSKATNSNGAGGVGGGSLQLEQQQQQQQQQEDQPAFNPFELQGLSELLAASGAAAAAGQFDMNNPLAGFMAAALAAQGQAGGAFGAGSGLPPPPPSAAAAAAAFNPFLMAPFGAHPPPGASSNTPDLSFMAELLSKMPPGMFLYFLGLILMFALGAKKWLPLRGPHPLLTKPFWLFWLKKVILLLLFSCLR